jgi:hypothetical protein
MSSRASELRRARQSRPGLEGLEGRELLSAAGPSTSAQIAPTVSPAQSTTIPRIRQLNYQTPQGAHVTVTLYGDGSLFGSTVDTNGGLNLRFSGTNAQTGIVGEVHGGSGFAPLESLQHLLVPAQSLSGLGSTLLNVVNLKNFNLVSGGRINLTGGVHVLFLNSVAADTQVNIRETPPDLLPGGSSSTSATENGVNLEFLFSVSGAQTLSGVSSVVVPGFNLLAAGQSSSSAPVPQAAPAGVVISIKYVNGPPRDTVLLGSPQIFGYDSTTNSLIRFDTITGNPTLTIPNALPAANANAGVTLARDNGQLVALISDGSNVYAYNPLDGSPVGSFSLANLIAEGVGLNNPTRLGTFDTYVAVSDPGNGPNNLGVIQPINVTASLATGQAVPIGPAYPSQRGFGLSGGMTGIPGLENLYTAGGAVFDQYEPFQQQLGIASLSPTAPSLNNAQVTLSEVARNALTTQSQTNPPQNTTTPTNSHGQSATSPNNALGSLDQNLALDTGLTTNAAGQTVNGVTLFSPTTYASKGTINLNDSNLLTGLSGSFFPALNGAALVDVQGNTQSFRSLDAQGLVFNGEGNVNLMKIQNAADTTIIGLPFGHAQIPHRSNVTIVSSNRSVGDRNGVTVIPNLQPTGPLSLPS